MEEVDAVDNGISQYDGEARYTVSTTVSARVAHLNPRWNSKSQDTEVSWKTVCTNTHGYKSDNTNWEMSKYIIYLINSRTKIVLNEM